MYGVSCRKCHTVVPQLTEFGAHFLASGDRIPGLAPGPAFPIATKRNVAGSYVRQGSGPDGAGLPKAIVDEIEVFTAGSIGTRASYFVEQYVVDGGEHGLLRDAWVNDRLNPWDARIPLYAQVGSYTLPVPVDPETFRESYAHYALFDQTVGNNPFDFFNPKIGLKITIGDTLHGANAQVFAGPGYDRQSGIRTTGIDTMEVFADAMGPFVPSVYHYGGVRPDRGAALDRFTRTGWGLVYAHGRWSSESMLQTGWDSSVNGTGAASNGGFTQVRYTLGPQWFALTRYEGTSDTLGGFSRDGVVLLGYGPTRNSRITLEDVIARVPQTTHTVNLQATIGY